ncbi:MAG: hypothetical protein MK085_01670 [Phycisphaerales bacterium]|nr:hypothetical protein [Phycisphaerales bacterium]
MRYTHFLILPVLALASSAVGQIDTKLVPRAFKGSPTTARVQGPSLNGSAELFRVYTFDGKDTLLKIEQGTIQMGVTLTVVYTNDESGRPTASDGEFMGNPTIRNEFTYDEKGRSTGYRQLMIKSGNATETMTKEHDDSGRVVKESVEKPARPAEVLVRTFDENGHPVKEVVSSGDRVLRTIRMEYDDNGCLVKSVIELPSGREDWSVWLRDEQCRATTLQKTTFAGRKTETVYAYDEKGNPLSETITDLGKPGSNPIKMIWSYTYPSADDAATTTEAKGD